MRIMIRKRTTAARRRKKRSLLRFGRRHLLTLSFGVLGYFLYRALVFWRYLQTLAHSPEKTPHPKDPVEAFLAERTAHLLEGLPPLFLLFVLSLTALVAFVIIFTYMSYRPATGPKAKEIDYKALRERVREFRSRNSS